MSVDMSKQCKHLESLGQHEVYAPGRKKPIQIVDKGFRCLIHKYPPPKVGPKVCVPRKRDCYEIREEEPKETPKPTDGEPEEGAP
jgi:hypothetical protein